LQRERLEWGRRGRPDGPRRALGPERHLSGRGHRARLGRLKRTDAYRVYRSTSSGVDASGSPLETGISSTEHVDETAENGTKYFYVVTAVATEGGENAESGPSNEVEKTPFSDPPDRP